MWVSEKFVKILRLMNYNFCYSISDKNSKDVEILECLIESRQNSMVFCNVAEVLKIYEKVSKNLYPLNDDLVMMRKFSNTTEI